MNCPLKSSDEWKELVAAVGSSDAYHALTMNNDIIPSRFKAKMLLDRFNGLRVNISNYMESFAYTGKADNDFKVLYEYHDEEEVEVEQIGPGVSQKLRDMLDKFSLKYRLPYDIVTDRQAKRLLESSGQEFNEGTKGFWYNGHLIMIDGRIDEETVLHEFAHPFVELLFIENNEAFTGIYKKLSNTATGREIINEVESEGAYVDEEQKMKEVMVRAISRVKEPVPESKFIALVKDFIRAIGKAINDLVGSRIVSMIDEDTTISELAQLIYDVDFDLPINSSILAGQVLRFDVTAAMEKLAEEDKKLEQYQDADGKQHYKHADYPDILNSNSEDTVKRMTASKSLRDKLEKRAKYLFASKNISIETGTYTDPKGQTFTFDEYVDYLDSVNADYRAIGKILHAYAQQLFVDKTANPDKWNELDAVIDQLFMSHPTLKRSKILEPFRAIDPDKGISVMKSIIGSSLNLVHKEFGIRKVGRRDDVLLSELKLALREIGIGTAADLVRISDDGIFSFYDFKFGRSFSNMNDASPSLHGEGTNVSQSHQDLAYMDLVKRVFMAKVLLGDDLRVSDVKILHITPGYTYRNTTVEPSSSVKSVDMQPYLTIFKRSLIAEGKKELVEKWDKLGYFEESTYRVVSQNTLDELKRKDLKTLPERKEYLIGQIELVNNLIESVPVGERDTVLTKSHRKRLMELTEALIDIEKDPEMPLYNLYEDTYEFRSYLGTQYDSDNPYAQMAMGFYRKQKMQRDEKALEYKKEFQRLVDNILNDNKVERLARNIVGTNPRKVYGPLYIEKDGLHGYGTYLISKTEDKAEWNRRVENGTLTQAHQDLHEFVTKTWQKEYENVAKHNLDAHFTRLDAYDKRRKNALPEELPEGFLPRTMMTIGEVKQQFTYRDLDPKFWKARWRRMQATLYDDDIYVNKQESGLSRVKYMPNEDILQAENYSLNLETAFDSFVGNLLDIQYLDPAISYTRGVQTLLRDNPLFRRQVTNVENTIDYLDKMVQINMLKVKNKPYTIPINGAKVNTDYAIQGLVTLTNTTLLALHPAIATANVTLIIMLSHIRAFANEIHAWAGNREKVDFTIGDMLKADLQYVAYIWSWMTGRLDKNKMHLLMEKFHFKATSYDYKSRASALRVGKSKVFDSSNLYIMNRVGEDYGSFVLFYSMMNHKKNPATGRSMYDSYVVKDGKVVWDESEKNNYGVRGKIERGVNEKGEMQYEELRGMTSEEISLMKDITRRINGSYREDEKTAIEVHAMSKIFIQFKRYMPVYLLEAYGGKYKDYSLERYEVKEDKDGVIIFTPTKETFGGSVPLALDFMKKVIKAGMFIEKFDLSKLSRKEKESLVYMGTMAATIIAYAFITGRFDPDDDEKKKFRATKLGIRLDRLVFQDFTRMMNPMDILNNLMNPFPSITFIAKFMVAWYEYFQNALMDDRLMNGEIRGKRQALNYFPILNVRNDYDKYYYNSPKEGQKTWTEFFDDLSKGRVR